jgi:hypothetical protein
LAATLLIRLGEAADGYRTGEPVFVVAGYDFPHAILGVFTTRRTATDSALRGGPDFGVFGPFVALRDLPPPREIPDRHHRLPEIIAGGGCAHMASSALRPAYCPAQLLQLLAFEEVVDITVAMRTRSGGIVSSTYDPREADAVFFTMAALDKFVFPYYAGLLGVEHAAAMRREIVERWSRP